MARPRLLLSLFLLTLPLLGAMSCSSGESETSATPVTAAEGEDEGEVMDHNEAADEGANGALGSGTDMDSAAAETAASFIIPMVEYTWDPQAGDASVSAEMGGPGFAGNGWETNMTFQALGSAEAVKGGSLKQYTPDWPATLRQHGKDWNSSINYTVNDLCYQGMLQLHSSTLKYIPSLATHWKISEDRSVYQFRINPDARWSDGSEVTSADVIATWDLRMDEKCLDPSSVSTYGKVERPVAISKYIVEITCITPNWRNFLYLATMSIWPAADVSIPGEEYLDKYQNSYTANSGPYIIKPEGIKMGTSIKMTRRTDWWDANNPAWVGLYNIGTYEYEVVMDPNLAFEKVKKGDLDYLDVNRSQWWAEEIPPLDAVKRGLLIPRKFYTDAPVGTSGIAINTQRPPLDDLRMRKVLQWLYNRELFIDKLFFNEYDRLNSYFQGGSYQNKSNEVVDYDPFAAVDLLDEMGWTEKDSEGIRVKDGNRLSFELTYSSVGSDSNLTIFQENAKDAGIEINITLETPAARWKAMRTKSFELTSTAWGALVIPNPETSFHGRFAGLVDNNNVTSFSNARVDELCTAYDEEYDVERRAAIIREIDGIIYAEQPYVLGWYLPCERMLFWNKFGMPAWGSARTADSDDLTYNWWVDPAKEAALKAALADSSLTMDPGSRKNEFWKHWNAAQ